MAISVPQINTAVDTFGTWITKFNTVANITSTQTVTADFSNTGSQTTGNVFVNGYFTTVNTYVSGVLYGGSPVNTSPISVGTTLNVIPGTINSLANSTVSLVNLTTNDTVAPETLNFSAVRTISGNTPQTVSFKIQSKQSNSFVQFDPFLANSNSQINAVGFGVGSNLGFYVTTNTVVVVNPITLQNTNISLLIVNTVNANVTNSVNVTANLVTTNTANVVNAEVSSVNTNFLTANTADITTLNSNSATITNLTTSNATVDVHSSNSITSNVFYSTTTGGYKFSNSNGYYYMDANNGVAVVPNGGVFYAKDVNGNNVTVRAANAVGTTDLVPLGQADVRYAALNGSSAQVFNTAGMNVHSTNSYSTIYTDANTNDFVINVGAGTNYIVFANNGNINTPGSVTSNLFVANNGYGYQFNNSTGSYYMDPTNGIATVPTGGGFYIRQANTADGPLHCASLTASGEFNFSAYYGIVWPSQTRIYADSSGDVGDFVVRTYNGSYYYSVFNNAGSLNVPGNITAGGNVTAGSDIKLKYNITIHDNALDKIKRLKPVEFNWKKDDTHSIGFIAQDVEEIYPEFVSEFKNKTEDGDEILKGIDYSKLTAPLVKAVQELSAHVEKLEQRIKELENK